MYEFKTSIGRYNMLRIPLEELELFEAGDKGIYVTRQGVNGSHTYFCRDRTLKELPDEHFVWINRQCRVARHAVRLLEGSLVTTRGGHQVGLSRRRKPEFRKWFKQMANEL